MPPARLTGADHVLEPFRVARLEPWHARPRQSGRGRVVCVKIRNMPTESRQHFRRDVEPLTSSDDQMPGNDRQAGMAGLRVRDGPRVGPGAAVRARKSGRSARKVSLDQSVIIAVDEDRCRIGRRLRIGHGPVNAERRAEDWAAWL